MRRIANQCLSFLVTFLTGVCIALLFALFKSDMAEIQAVAILEDNPTPPAVAPSSSPSDLSTRNVDFRNYTYPGIWYKQPFHLTNGTAEVQHEHCDSLYTFDDVQYLNLTGGPHKEALVTINDLTACGSSGMSLYFYVYSFVGNSPRLLWKFGTGADSEAGLKDFQVSGGTLVLDLYGNYRAAGTKPKVVAWPHFCCPDCCPEKFTRLWFSWNGRRFVQIRRAVFPFPFKSIEDYEKTRKHTTQSNKRLERTRR